MSAAETLVLAFGFRRKSQQNMTSPNVQEHDFIRVTLLSVCKHFVICCY